MTARGGESSSFPGGTSISMLDVYDDAAPDGIRGGSPHVHLVSTECYIVTSGRGALHTLDTGGYRETALRPGSVVWFTPGTIHRAVNEGDLRVVVLMSNAGLPEAGDAVMTFPPEVLADADAYRSAASLAAADPQAPDPLAPRAASARRRRDLAVQGFIALRRAVERDGPAALDPFYDAAAALVEERAASWPAIVRERPLRQAETSLAHALAIAAGDGAHVRAGGVRVAAPPAGERGFGMCGRLRAFDVGDRPAS